MGEHEKTYCCIDLKSFYASVECVERGLDPFSTRLVVADRERGEKTICLAVSPALKALGVSGRPRVFQLPKHLDYIMARPRMRLYMEVSARIVEIYLRHISKDDLHIYSIDECFIDLTPYIKLYGKDARELVEILRSDVLRETGITATAGIGSNLFLAKVALDVTAKHTPDGVGVLDAHGFRQTLWHHRPITDIWQIGKGIARRLENHGIYNLYDLAHANVDMLYREFGVNAEYLIDHAWGIEPCTIADIKAYTPKGKSLMNGQVLPYDYSFEEGRIIAHEMVDESTLDLIEQQLVAGQVSLYVGYKADSDTPGHASISKKLSYKTNSFKTLAHEIDSMYCEAVSPTYPIRRINIGFGNLEPEHAITQSLFTDGEEDVAERSRQEALIAIKHKFGKSAVMRGTSYRKRARGLERANQIGGHRA